MDDGSIRVKATSAAVAAFVVAAASVIALVVVLSVEDADVLAAVALTFGLVAFMAQLVIAVAQFSSAQRSQAEVGRINADTQAVLSEIRRANDEIVASQRSIVERLLGQAISSAQAQATTPAEAEAVERVRANLLGITPTRTLPDPGRDERVAALQEIFKQWVQQEGFDYVETPPALEGAPVIKVDDTYVVVGFALGHADPSSGDASFWSGRLRDQLVDEEVIGLQVWERGDDTLGAGLATFSNTIHAWPDSLRQVPRMIREHLLFGRHGEDDEGAADPAEDTATAEDSPADP